MNDRPKLVFNLVFYALIAGFFLLSVFGDVLPEEILGFQSSTLSIYLIISAILIRYGWRIVMWFRRRNQD